jgi:hypothetical protein
MPFLSNAKKPFPRQTRAMRHLECQLPPTTRSVPAHNSRMLVGLFLFSGDQGGCEQKNRVRPYCDLRRLPPLKKRSYTMLIKISQTLHSCKRNFWRPRRTGSTGLLISRGYPHLPSKTLCRKPVRLTPENIEWLNYSWIWFTWRLGRLSWRERCACEGCRLLRRSL